jgi:hypothetical protein
MLAQGDQRTEDAWRQRHPDRGGRRAEGFSRGDHLGLSADRGADLHRALDPQQPGIRVLEGSQGNFAGDQAIYRAENADMALVRLEEFGPNGAGLRPPPGAAAALTELAARPLLATMGSTTMSG